MHTDKKRILFYIILIIIPVAFFLILEGGLRLVGYGYDLSLFQTIPRPKGYDRINPNLGKRYIQEEGTRLLVTNDLMLREKPADGLRIFVLGGSSVAGYPYLENGTFSRMLRDRLEDTADRPIEVINLAMPAVNSFTLLDIADELFDYQPDALIIYSGHNEFYGALGISSNAGFSQNRWLINLILKIQHLRLVQMLRDIITGFRAIDTDRDNPLQADRQTLMQRLVKEEKIPYQSERYQQALEIYQNNLQDIVDMARENQIPLFIGELVSNLADQSPFISLEDERADKQLKATLASADSFQIQQLLREKTPSAAVHYKVGTQLQKKGKFIEAQEHFTRAKDLDLLRFRASEDFNRVLHLLSEEDHVFLVPLIDVYEQHSPNGLIGDSLMIDHLHPRVEGYQLIAAAFYEALHQHEIGSRFDTRRLLSDRDYQQRSGITALDRWVADFRIAVLKKGWPFSESSQIASFIDRFQPENFLQTTGLALWKEDLNWLKAHLVMAAFYEKKGELSAAAEEYAALSKAYPFDQEMPNHLGRLLIAQGRIVEARAVLEKSYTKKPTNFAARMLGAIHTEQKEYQIGIRYLQKAIDLNPRDVQSLYNLSGAYFMTGAYNQALDMLENLLSIDPNNQNAKRLLKQVKLKAGVR
jgi:tetratricopeptide (TPR) repeat protein